MRGSVVPTLSPDEIAAFWAQTIRQDTGCLEWTGQFNGLRGVTYGLFTIRRDGRRVRLMANRVALALSSPQSDGIFACHHCDNPPCVEPSHLYWGDAKSNNADMYSRGREHVNSEGHPGLLGLPRPDVTRRWVAEARANGYEAISVVSNEIDWWMREDAIDSMRGLEAFVARVDRGDGIAVDWGPGDTITEARLADLAVEAVA